MSHKYFNTIFYFKIIHFNNRYRQSILYIYASYTIGKTLLIATHDYNKNYNKKAPRCCCNTGTFFYSIQTRFITSLFHSQTR